MPSPENNQEKSIHTISENELTETFDETSKNVEKDDVKAGGLLPDEESVWIGPNEYKPLPNIFIGPGLMDDP